MSKFKAQLGILYFFKATECTLLFLFVNLFFVFCCLVFLNLFFHNLPFRFVFHSTGSNICNDHKANISKHSNHNLNMCLVGHLKINAKFQNVYFPKYFLTLGLLEQETCLLDKQKALIKTSNADAQKHNTTKTEKQHSQYKTARCFWFWFAQNFR